eukprot:m.102029 g.102029  ORF g.102029 m.102029 type:complete len:56 (+) comp14998_c0_seq1:739-906(+)
MGYRERRAVEEQTDRMDLQARALACDHRAVSPHMKAVEAGTRAWLLWRADRAGSR